MIMRGKVIGYAILKDGRVTVKEFAKMRKSKRRKRKPTPRQLAALRRARAALCAIYGVKRRKRKRRATPAQMRALRKAWAARRRMGRRRMGRRR